YPAGRRRFDKTAACRPAKFDSIGRPENDRGDPTPCPQRSSDKHHHRFRESAAARLAVSPLFFFPPADFYRFSPTTRAILLESPLRHVALAERPSPPEWRVHDSRDALSQRDLPENSFPLHPTPASPSPTHKRAADSPDRSGSG